MMFRGLVVVGLALGALNQANASDMVRAPATNDSPIIKSLNCQSNANCIDVWNHLSRAQRIEVWPQLDNVTRARFWSVLQSEERAQLRKQLADADKRAARTRYLIEHEQVSMVQTSSPSTPPMCDEERTLLRRQILEVHLELHNGKKPHRDCDLCSSIKE